MAGFRNLVWRLVAISFLGLFGYAIYIQYFTHTTTYQFSETSRIGFIAAMVVGFFVPTRILKIPSTLNHEVGHALMASILRETVNFIRVEPDTSGVTYFHGKMSRMHIFLRSAAGPLASAILLLFTTLLITQNHAIFWILFTIISTVFITLSTVRSIYGWISAGIVTFALFRALQLSLQISSNIPEQMQFGIWYNSTWNLPLLIAAYSTGVGLRYSLICRKPWDEGQDEVKIGRALGLGPRFGGHLVLLLNIAITALAVQIIR